MFYIYVIKRTMAAFSFSNFCFKTTAVFVVLVIMAYFDKLIFKGWLFVGILGHIMVGINAESISNEKITLMWIYLFGFIAFVSLFVGIIYNIIRK